MSLVFHDCFFYFLQDVDEQELEQIAYASLEDHDELDYRDDGYIELVLRMLGAMCDGQNTTVQVRQTSQHKTFV